MCASSTQSHNLNYFHQLQGDHRFWLRSESTQDVARNYLNMRHKLAPSLIAAGRTVQYAGFPLTARCDLIWPQHPEAKDSTQYIHLNATLVAPLDVEPVDNVTNTRSVWLPPGEWIDGWSGKTINGPQTIHVTKTMDKVSNIIIYFFSSILLLLYPTCYLNKYFS